MTALVPDLKERQKSARARAGRIRLGIKDYIQTLGWIAQARAEDDHLTLGYETWAEYVDGEYGDARIQLPSEMRRKAVEELRLAGASQREIGHTLGVSQTQVRRDLTEPKGSPEDQEQSARTPLVEAMTGAIEDAGQRAQDHRVPTQPGAPEPDPLATVPDPDAAAGAFPPPVAAPEERTDEEGAPDHPVESLGEVNEPGDEADVTRTGEPVTSVDPELGDSPVPGSGSQNGTEEGPGCEKCGALLEQEHWELGFLRCEGCDPEGDHLPGDESGDCRICSVCPTCGKPRWSTT